MISIALSWFSFIMFVSLLPNLTQFQYLLYGSCMLGFTCLYNFIYSVKIPFNTIIIIFTIPTIICWYVAFVYNDFLSLTPMKSEIFIVSFFYLCFLTFMFCSKPQTKTTLKIKKTIFK